MSGLSQYASGAVLHPPCTPLRVLRKVLMWGWVLGGRRGLGIHKGKGEGFLCPLSGTSKAFSMDEDKTC